MESIYTDRWAAHLGRTSSAWTKEHRAHLGCGYGPHLVEYMGPTCGPLGRPDRVLVQVIVLIDHNVSLWGKSPTHGHLTPWGMGVLPQVLGQNAHVITILNC